MNISKPTESAYYLLEAVRLSGNQTKIVLAGSTEVFGSHGKNSITENTLKKPMSPYAAGKLAQESVVAYYRNSYGTWVSNVHLSNHEYIYRGSEFVTMKIVNGAYNIAAGKLSRLKLGNLAVIRDWGWAPEFMDALILLSLKDKPEDLIIATGSSISLFDFAIEVFNFFGLSFERHVEYDPLLLRMSDPSEVHYDVSKARNVLGWEAIIKGKDLPKKLAKSFEGLLDANV